MTVDFDAADVEVEEVAMAAAVEAAVQNSVSAMSSMIVRPHLVAETVVAEVETLVAVVVSLARKLRRTRVPWCITPRAVRVS